MPLWALFLKKGRKNCSEKEGFLDVVEKVAQIEQELGIYTLSQFTPEGRNFATGIWFPRPVRYARRGSSTSEIFPRPPDLG